MAQNTNEREVFSSNRKEQVMKQVVEALNNFATNWGPDKAEKAYDLFESALERKDIDIELCSDRGEAVDEAYRSITEMVVGVLAEELRKDPAGRGRKGVTSFDSEFRAAMRKVGDSYVGDLSLMGDWVKG